MINIAAMIALRVATQNMQTVLRNKGTGSIPVKPTDKEPLAGEAEADMRISHLSSVWDDRPQPKSKGETK